MQRLLVCIAIVVTMGTAFAQIARDSGTVLKRCNTISQSPLSKVPPYREDMPGSVQRAYRFVDSLAHVWSTDQVDSFVRTIGKLDDAMPLLEWYYAVKEYDPLLYMDYWYNADYLDTTYTARAGAFLRDVVERVDKLQLLPPFRQALLEADVIVHGRIEHVDEDTTRFADGKGLIRCVTFKAVDLLKGKSLANLYQLKLEYWPIMPKILVRAYDGIIDSYTPASTQTFLRPDSSTDIHNSLYEIGKEYIIFLELHSAGFDGTLEHYYFWPLLHRGSPGGAFPIDANGDVIDERNIFGMGHHVPFRNFKTALRKTALELGGNR